MHTRIETFLKVLFEFKKIDVVQQGLLVTLVVAIFGLILGILIGVIIATSKVIPKYKLWARIWEKINDVYVAFFRGTPIVVQLLIGFFVLPAMLGFNAPKENFQKILFAILIYGMNSGAYVSEVIRGGLQSVDIGQMEASRAVGLSYVKSMRKVVIPQAFKNIVPTLGNEFITLVKETSVVGFVAIIDITRAFQNIGAQTYDYIIPYLTLAACYLVIVILITIGIRMIEKRLKRSDR